MEDTDEAIAADIEAVSRIGAVPLVLRVICQTTGAGFAAVARVTDKTWTACAVRDDIPLGLQPGGRLDIDTTLCKEVRAAHTTIAFDDASTHPTYCGHPTPKLYGFRSYISMPIVLADGEYFGNLCALDPRPLPLSDQRTLDLFTLFVQMIGRLITEERGRRETDAALASERVTAELREQFIAVLGHDLRDPLAAIIAIGSILEQPRPPAELPLLGQRLRKSARRMSSLIEDVLDVARGRLGAGMILHMAEHERLDALLADVVSDLQAVHDGHQIRSTFDIATPVYCDGTRLQQLLSNLVKNALTHGAAEIPVTIDAGTADGWLTLSVHNGGEPLSAEQLQRVYEPYWRPSHAGKGRGLGLGLYICTQIVKAHGGTLEATSSADTGTRFRVRLPVSERAA